MARGRYRKSYNKKRRSNPKNTKVYKMGMRNTAIGFSVVGVLAMAVFHKTGIAQQILANTPTFNGEG